ncbi:hypothetical protein O2L52_10240, partial [Glycomyces algeriensis]
MSVLLATARLDPFHIRQPRHGNSAAALTEAAHPKAALSEAAQPKAAGPRDARPRRLHAGEVPVRPLPARDRLSVAAARRHASGAPSR